MIGYGVMEELVPFGVSAAHFAIPAKWTLRPFLLNTLSGAVIVSRRLIPISIVNQKDDVTSIVLLVTNLFYTSCMSGTELGTHVYLI